ncbi:homeobox protein 4-like [Sabethes cyaneus]|uniref:homeobox protein 4-like n=1 Tax=Sabethes cyaneus TaxID=53552 RepID=UPI00237ED105|nr:homeobox protein 4-like [Sabethes cyaneus]
MAFDIKTATAIVMPYDGSAENLGSFVDAANLLDELTDPAHKAVAVKFIRCRLSGRARLGLPENIDTIQQLINNVKTRCADLTTPENVIAKLKATSQKNNINSFCSEVETLTDQLQNIYISKKVPQEMAQSMATKAGIDALINGVKNDVTKLILQAGTFATIRDAVQKVTERGTEETPNAAQIFHINNNRWGNRRNNNWNQRGGNNNRGRNLARQYGQNNRGYGNYNNYHNQNNNDFSTNNGYRNENRRPNNQNRGYGNHNRYNSNNERFRGRNVYYAENDQSSSVQPQTETREMQEVAHPRA